MWINSRPVISYYFGCCIILFVLVEMPTNTTTEAEQTLGSQHTMFRTRIIHLILIFSLVESVMDPQNDHKCSTCVHQCKCLYVRPKSQLSLMIFSSVSEYVPHIQHRNGHPDFAFIPTSNRQFVFPTQSLPIQLPTTANPAHHRQRSDRVCSPIIGASELRRPSIAHADPCSC